MHHVSQPHLGNLQVTLEKVHVTLEKVYPTAVGTYRQRPKEALGSLQCDYQRCRLGSAKGPHAHYNQGG